MNNIKIANYEFNLEKYKFFILGFFLLSLYGPFTSLMPYWDDLARFNENYIGLFFQGRIFTELYYRFQDFSSSISDVYFFNLIAIATLSLILFKIEVIKKDYFIFILLFSSPFLLENFSYHVDVIGMMTAYIFSIYAAFYTNDSVYKNLIVTLIIGLLAVFSYQAALNSYLISTLVVVIYNIDHSKQVKNILKVKITAFVILVIAAKLFLLLASQYILFRGGTGNTYMEQRSQLNIAAIPKQTYLFSVFFWSSFNNLQKFLLIMMSAMYSLASMTLIIQKIKSKEFLTSFLIIVLPLITIIFTLFPYNLVDNIELIKCRVLFGFGGILALLYVLTKKVIKTNLVYLIYIAYVLTFLMSVSAYVSSYNYKINTEKHFYEEVYAKVAKDGHKINLILCGSNTYVFNKPYLSINMNKFPIFKHLIYDYSLWDNGINGFFAYQDLNIHSQGNKNCSGQGNLIFNDRYYSIFYNSENTYKLVFKN